MSVLRSASEQTADYTAPTFSVTAAATIDFKPAASSSSHSALTRVVFIFRRERARAFRPKRFVSPTIVSPLPLPL